MSTKTLRLQSLCMFWLYVIGEASSNKSRVSNVQSENATAWSWWWEYPEPPSIEEIQQQVTKTKKDMKREIDRSMTQMEKDAKQLKRDVQRDAYKMKRLLIKNVKSYVFEQRVGWDRFRHSVRDFTGLSLGTTVAFTGYSNSILRNGGNTALQTAQIGWELCLLANLPNEPWLQDAVAGAVGLVAWRLHGAGTSRIVPPIFLFLAAFHTVGTVLNGLLQDFSDIPVYAFSGAVSLLGLCALAARGVPIAMAAASISGAWLMIDSIGAEIAGNWLHMLENMVWYVLPTIGKGLRLVARFAKLIWKLFKLLGNMFKPFDSPLSEPAKRQISSTARKMVSIVRKTYATMQRAKDRICNNRLLRSAKVVISSMFRYRLLLLPWTIAAVGISFQMKRTSSYSGERQVPVAGLNPRNGLLKGASPSPLLCDLKAKLAMLMTRFRAASDRLCRGIERA